MILPIVYTDNKNGQTTLQYGRVKAANADEIDLQGVTETATKPSNPKNNDNRITANRVTIDNYTNTTIQFREVDDWHGTPFLSGDKHYSEYLNDNTNTAISSSSSIELKSFKTSITNLGGGGSFDDKFDSAYRISIQTSDGEKVGLRDWQGWDHSVLPYAPRVATCSTQQACRNGPQKI